MAKNLVKAMLVLFSFQSLAFGEFTNPPITKEEPSFSTNYNVICENENHHIFVSERLTFGSLYQFLNYKGIYGIGKVAMDFPSSYRSPLQTQFVLQLPVDRKIVFYIQRTHESQFSLEMTYFEGDEKRTENLICN